MATLIASAKLTNAFRFRVVDKNVSAAINSTSTFTATVFRTRRIVSDLESNFALANTMRYSTKGGKGEFAVSSSLVCEFPTYIEIDIEALMLQGLPEGTDCVLNFQEGWMLEDRGRQLPSGAYEYGSNTQDAPAPEFPSFITFRTPKFFRSAFNAIVSMPATTVLRIKQIQSAVASASTLSAVAIFNPGKFAALFAGVSQAVTIARKTAVSGATISSIVTTVVNNTRARLFESSVASQFTMPPIDFWYRRLGVSAMTSTATMNSNAIKNISISLSLSGVSTMTTSAVKNTNVIVPMVANNSVSAQVNYRIDSLIPTMAATSSLEFVTDVRFIMQTNLNAVNYLGNSLTNTTTVNVPIYSYTYAGTNVTIEWGDGETTTYTSPTSGNNLPLGGTNHTYAQHGEYDIRIRVSGGTLMGMTNMELAGTAYPNTNWTDKIKSFITFGHRNFTASGTDLTFARLFARVPYQSLYVPNELPLAGNANADFRLESMFENTLANPPQISNWTFKSREVVFGGIFVNTPNFNQPFTNWSLTNITGTINYGSLVAGAGNFNQPITFWRFPDGTFNSGGQFSLSLAATNMNSENWNRTLIALANALSLNTRTTAPTRFIATVTRPQGATTNSTVYGSGSYTNGNSARNYLISRGWTVG